MNVYVCSICGSVKNENQSWFLLAQNRWRDRLKIMRWDENRASLHATFHACGPNHVKEFLHAWVTSNEFPYPNKTLHCASLDSMHDEVPSIGNLSIHRHGLKNSHESLKPILDAIDCV